ncbi:gp54 protein [Mycobacteroides abscessus subsp. massiliense]|uniref:BRO-N domain-containing protein n=1 Tax=Mycobacteroides abscessus TaxID=36809 RepID=UPI0009A72536|nr:Bro-N domain-containing protein [Mycobacteroides abscessus]SKI79621.1 gp54 protein [Mycobacteroides abscessus subsp. massiliense]
MSAVELFTYADADQLRVILRDGSPWFVATDILALLDVNRSSLTALDGDEKGVHAMDTPGGVQSVTIISESGFYSLVLRSRKPEATAIKRWITREVLPVIRRTGSYGTTPVERLTPLEYAKRLVDAEQRAESGQQFRRAIEAGDGITLTAFHKKYFSAIREIDFFTHLYVKKWLINQRGKGSMRTEGPRAGTRRDGSEHRHPTFKGKPYMYLHGSKADGDHRRENTRVRPGRYELQLRDRLVAEGLPANENTCGLFELGCAQ